MVLELVDTTRGRMEKTINDLTRNLSSIRTGRASVHLLDQVVVNYYGTQTPINQLATLHVPEPSLITIQPWDISQIGEIEKAIMASSLGVTPSSDGRLIRLPIPPLTQERRQELARHVGSIAEDHRTALRNIRRDVNEKLKKALKDKKISEDEEYNTLKEVQKITDEYVANVGDLAAQKQQEILEI